MKLITMHYDKHLLPLLWDNSVIKIKWLSNLPKGRAKVSGYSAIKVKTENSMYSLEVEQILNLLKWKKSYQHWITEE